MSHYISINNACTLLAATTNWKHSSGLHIHTIDDKGQRGPEAPAEYIAADYLG